MLPEYDFDLSKGKPNRFAAKMSEDVVVIVLESDVSKVFRTSESVNRALRAMIEAMATINCRKSLRVAVRACSATACGAWSAWWRFSEK